MIHIIFCEIIIENGCYDNGSENMLCLYCLTTLNELWRENRQINVIQLII